VQVTGFQTAGGPVSNGIGEPAVTELPVGEYCAVETIGLEC